MHYLVARGLAAWRDGQRANVLVRPREPGTGRRLARARQGNAGCAFERGRSAPGGVRELHAAAITADSAALVAKASVKSGMMVRSGTTAILVRRILLIPSWEGPSADPEEKRGPASDIPHQIDGASDA
jgi:hypothetical protein